MYSVIRVAILTILQFSGQSFQKSSNVKSHAYPFGRR